MGYQLRPQENKNLLERDWDEGNKKRKVFFSKYFLFLLVERNSAFVNALDLECPETPMCKRIGPHPVALLEAGKSFQGWG